jgi:hypothetical protein
MALPSKSKAKLEPGDYERLGREVEKVVIKDYIQFVGSTPRQIWRSLVHGIFGGLGGVLGATVGVAFLLLLLQYFGGLPYIGQFVDSVADSIRHGIRR